MPGGSDVRSYTINAQRNLHPTTPNNKRMKRTRGLGHSHTPVRIPKAKPSSLEHKVSLVGEAADEFKLIKVEQETDKFIIGS